MKILPNLMIEKLITIDTARLAKEKGFDQNGITWLFYEENGRMFNNLEDIGNQDYICCTQELLKKWLREKKGIHVNPEPYQETADHTFELTGYFVGQINTTDGKMISPGDDNYSTYEEALEKGLQIGLKHIEL